MSRTKTAGLPRQDRAWVTAAEWFAGGQRIGYDPESARVLTEEEAAQLRRLVEVGHRSEPKSNGAEAENALVFGFLHLIEEQYQPAAVRSSVSVPVSI